MVINKKLLRKVIERIETTPESYAQDQWECSAITYNEIANEVFQRLPRPAPECGTVACLAGEIIICSEPTIQQGIQKLREMDGGYREAAGALIGIDPRDTWGVFSASAIGWPSQFRDEFDRAMTYRDQARAAVNYLKHILKTGKVTE